MGGSCRIGGPHLPHHAPLPAALFCDHGLRSHRRPEAGTGVGKARESTGTTERYTHLINPKLDEAYRLTFENR